MMKVRRIVIPKAPQKTVSKFGYFVVMRPKRMISAKAKRKKKNERTIQGGE